MGRPEDGEGGKLVGEWFLVFFMGKTRGKRFFFLSTY